jgi:hypothetical protein
MKQNDRGCSAHPRPFSLLQRQTRVAPALLLRYSCVTPASRLRRACVRLLPVPC